MATATLATKPSTRRLSEVARHVVIPSGIVSTAWPSVEARCREFGDEFDEWQRGAGQLILAKRADGSYAATIGGVTLSIPRQVAKTFLVGRIVFALCVLFPGLRVIWTAHRTRTATNTFKHLQGYAKRAKVAPHIADIRRTNGEQEILFTNTSIIMFGAREAGFGRGFDEVDIEVFDEAQILTSKALEDMVAATNQSRHPHGALLFFMGTPPRPVDPGEAFTIRREEALAYKPEGSAFGEPVIGDEQLYIECSAEPTADPDDRKQWAVANPSYPHRTPLRSMLRLRRNLPSVDSWRREALGIWDGSAAALWLLVAEDEWSLCKIEDHQPSDNLRWAVAVGTASRSAAVGVSDGIHIEVAAYAAGTSWLAEWFRARPHITEVTIASTGPANSVTEDLDAAGVTYNKVALQDQAGGLAALVEDVKERRAVHIGQEPLDEAVAGAVTRKVEDVQVLSRSKSLADSAPLEAVMLARRSALQLVEDGDFLVV